MGNSLRCINKQKKPRGRSGGCAISQSSITNKLVPLAVPEVTNELTLEEISHSDNIDIEISIVAAHKELAHEVDITVPSDTFTLVEASLLSDHSDNAMDLNPEEEDDVLAQIVNSMVESETIEEPSSSHSDQNTPTAQRTPTSPMSVASISAEEEPIDRQFNVVSVNTISFAVPDGYSKKLEYLGGGSYGNVVKTTVLCRDGLTRTVAVKKLRNSFVDPSHARRVFREIKLLQLMKHDNVVRAIDLYTPDKVEHQFKDVYVVMEYAGDSLLKILNNQLTSGQRFLKPEHVTFIVYQVLRALKYMHSAEIIHRDLKPGNLALTSECDLTVLDLGLARSLKNETDLTDYIMTRWYRSPEVIYWNIGSYNTQADIWSLGCIAAELMLGKPLFPGENTSIQYTRITELCGSPDDDLLNKIEATNDRSMRLVIESFEKFERQDFGKRFRGCDEVFIDFLDNILVLDPEKRMTVKDALKHPYMAAYHDASDEPEAEWCLEDPAERSLAQWKAVIWHEIANFNGDNHSPRRR